MHSVNGEHKTGEAAAPRALLKESDFRALLGGMSERKFKALRAAGVIPAPLELSPRVARWTHDDFAAVVAALPRREPAPEPLTLAQGRRARIDAIKRGGVSTEAAQ